MKIIKVPLIWRNWNPGETFQWFRSWLKPNEIELKCMKSELVQKADILTKSLSTATFEINRKLSSSCVAEVE
jgi:hypothetical protein